MQLSAYMCFNAKFRDTDPKSHTSCVKIDADSKKMKWSSTDYNKY